MSDLINGSIGPEAKYDISLTGGKLVLSLVYQGAEAGLTTTASVGLKPVLEKLKALIPQSSIRDEVFALVEAAIPA